MNKMEDYKLEEAQREQTICIACQEEKDKGLVVCWNCFKYIDNPYKYSDLDFEDWLNEVIPQYTSCTTCDEFGIEIIDGQAPEECNKCLERTK